MQRLYDLGARRVLVTGTGPLGCVPAELAQHSRNGECATELQHAASLYNPQLDDMLISLNQELGSHVFVGVNTRKMHNDFMSNPEAYGELKYSLTFLTAIPRFSRINISHLHTVEFEHPAFGYHQMSCW